MKYIITGISAIVLVAWMASCSSSTKTTEEASYGIQITDMDTTANPKEDFYQYANGGWLDRTEIPADRGRWGSFDALRKRTTQNVLTLMEGSSVSDFEDGSDQKKAFVFFQTGMDTQWANENGIKPIESLLTQVEEVKDVATLQKFMEDTEPFGLSVFFGFGVSPDARNSEVYATYLGGGALGLPDRDYYVKDDEESKRIKNDYMEHIERMLPFIGYEKEEAKAAAQAIVDLETALADPRMDKVQRRNPLLRYNKRSIDELEEMLPAIEWAQYFEGIGAGKLDTLIVSDPKYIQSLVETFDSFEPETWRHYLKWTVLNDFSTRLTTEIDKANFDFYGNKLRGLEEQRPREERMIDVCNGAIGEALGKLYVDQYFPQEAKQVASDMVDNILKAFDKRIKNLEWMTDSTKEKALTKLSTFTVKIGYPDKWKDYGKMVVQSKEEGGTYASNIMNVSKFNYEKQLSRIGQEVDDSEWFMAPQVVNAYYNPLQNEIVFPAAILQPPFYDYRADAAVNYGGIGAVIGHEISHGFDDQGSRFDAEGNMNNWWTDADREAFESRNRKLIDQFNAYEPLPGINVNGAFTLGENIGDLGGINVAYDGLLMHLKENGEPGMIDGMSPSERFFLSWGTIWRTKYRDEALKTQIKTDPHSPAMYRAIGPLSNFPPFYETYGIQDGDAAFRADSNRVNIW